ncbi:hypothetical protein RHGRI_015456 [Rhododendron griersonianum]|uniref:Uncharacterized protein n=1 Tax=Rhododendron griersonianum TaxID=479676 RepID=A0AAV6KDV7_9ERIC|nr:hypothetical protein RHGRI_015456 [Rhododendron griersonianum]
MEIHPTEMSQGDQNDFEEALERLTSTVIEKIGEGAQKTKSVFFSACIYRVLEELRKLKESAYTPRIAIVPLHRNDKHLQTPLQHIKMSYTDYLPSRLTVGIEDLELPARTKFTVVRKCLAEMKTFIDDAKKCYAKDVSSSNFSTDTSMEPQR